MLKCYKLAANIDFISLVVVSLVYKKHIIMFKITDALNEEDREKKVLQMQAVFGDLKNKIDIIHSFEIGVNSRNTPFSYDVVINSEFASWKDLEAYVKHPEHQKAIALSKSIKKEKAVVDYELKPFSFLALTN